MVTVSNNFLSALRSGAEQDIRFEFVTGEVIDKSRISASGGFQYQQYFNQDGDLQMGTAIMSTIEVSLLNHDGYFDGFDFTKECMVRYGVKVGNAYEYVPMGVFQGDRADRIKSNVIRYTANDRMALFEKDASAFIEGLTFPVSINQIYRDLCSFVGIGYTTTSLTNGGKTLYVNPFSSSDYTCREVLAWIAEAACSYAMIDRNGKVKMAWFSAAGYTVLPSDRFNLALSEIESPVISKLEVYTSYSDMLNTYGSGDNLYVISDNPFLYAENDTDKANLQSYVNTIYNKLSGIPLYYPMSFRALTNPAIEGGDIITVITDDRSSLIFPVFSQTIRWSGNGKTEYENTGNAKRENVPIAQRELENIKKKMLKNTDLSTSIDSYLNTAEGKAGIVSAVEGKFVTPDDLGGYVTTTMLNTSIEQYIDSTTGSAKIVSAVSGTYQKQSEMGSYAKKTDIPSLDGYVTTAELTQKISAVDSKISLTAGVGKGTIGSNVQAMLTLFANADSSSIKLKANAIDLSGYVTVTALGTAGATTINGANVTTDNLYIRKIYGDKGSLLEDVIVMATSGRNVALGNPSSIGYSTNITVWGNNISFISKNAQSSSDYLVISTVDTNDSIEGISYGYPQCIYPYSASGGNWSWDIGNEEYAFAHIYIDKGVYLYDSRNDAWTRLYVSSGHLYWKDWDGVTNKLASGS